MNINIIVVKIHRDTKKKNWQYQGLLEKANKEKNQSVLEIVIA